MGPEWMLANYFYQIRESWAQLIEEHDNVLLFSQTPLYVNHSKVPCRYKNSKRGIILLPLLDVYARHVSSSSFILLPNDSSSSACSLFIVDYTPLAGFSPYFACFNHSYNLLE